LSISSLNRLCDVSDIHDGKCRWRGSENDVVHFSKSILKVLFVECSNGECRFLGVLSVILEELSPSASSFSDGMDGCALGSEKDTDIVWLNNESYFDALMWYREEHLWWKSVCSRCFFVNDVSKMTKFIICSVDVLNRSPTNDEFSESRFFVFIPSGDSGVGVKCQTIDGGALFSKKETDMVFVDEKSGRECLEGGR